MKTPDIVAMNIIKIKKELETPILCISIDSKFDSHNIKVMNNGFCPYLSFLLREQEGKNNNYTLREWCLDLYTRVFAFFA